MQISRCSAQLRITVSLIAHISLFGYGIFPSALHAADWNLSKQIGLETTFSDNLDLSASDKVSDVFFSLNPGFVLQREGRYLQADIAYSPHLTYYFSESSNNRLDHDLQANAQAELYEDRFFVDVTATAQQEFINPLQARGDTNNTTDNIQTTYSYIISPSLTSNLGRHAEVLFAVENSGVFYSQEGADSYSYGANLQLRSRQDSSRRFIWELNTETETVEYESNQNDFNSLSMTVGRELTNQLKIAMFVGYENNNYASTEETSGMQWGSVLDWNPTSRTSLQAIFGEHYYGTSSNLEFQHRKKRSAWSVSYTRELASARSQTAQQSAFSFEDSFGEPTIPNVGQTESKSLNVDNASPTSDVFLSDQFSLEYALETRRSNLSANLSYVNRDYGEIQGTESAVQLSLDWTRQLSAKTSGFTGFSWRQTDAGDTEESDTSARNEEFSVRTGLSRTLSEHLNMDFIYQFRNGDDYTENRLSLGIAADW
jgi:uncharacterized protein (PEP-CTERM system associated)